MAPNKGKARQRVHTSSRGRSQFATGGAHVETAGPPTEGGMPAGMGWNSQAYQPVHIHILLVSPLPSRGQTVPRRLAYSYHCPPTLAFVPFVDPPPPQLLKRPRSSGERAPGCLPKPTRCSSRWVPMRGVLARPVRPSRSSSPTMPHVVFARGPWCRFPANHSCVSAPSSNAPDPSVCMHTPAELRMGLRWIAGLLCACSSSSKSIPTQALFLSL